VKNGIKKGTFLLEFSNLLESLVTCKGFLCILGDFNIHWNDTSDSETLRLVSILETLGLQQHVTEGTHLRGNIIDFVISRKDDNILTNCYVGELISDHHIIHASLKYDNTKFERKTIG